jgi:hypothetical protein
VVVRAALRDRRFWWLAAAFVAHGAAMAAMTVHLVGYLVHKGQPASFAASVAGLLGVLSVAGRVLLTGVQRRLPLPYAVGGVFTIQATAALALAVVGRSRIGAALAVVGFGIGFGVASLVKPAMLADRYGTTAYATINGILTTPITLAKAGAPLAAAGLLSTAGGYPVMLATVAAACLVAALAITTRVAGLVQGVPPSGQGRHGAALSDGVQRWPGSWVPRPQFRHGVPGARVSRGRHPGHRRDNDDHIGKA